MLIIGLLGDVTDELHSLQDLVYIHLTHKLLLSTLLFCQRIRSLSIVLYTRGDFANKHSCISQRVW